MDTLNSTTGTANLHSFALRRGTTVSVHVFLLLPNSCMEARIVDVYPGGNIQFVQDPGVAQVYVTMQPRPGSQICLQVLRPWMDDVQITDAVHDEVQIIVNDVVHETVRIIAVESTDYVVYGLGTGMDNRFIACSIVPAATPHSPLFAPQFGPAPLAECQAWTSQHCGSIPDLP
jgi:hypothetical protein